MMSGTFNSGRFRELNTSLFGNFQDPEIDITKRGGGIAQRTAAASAGVRASSEVLETSSTGRSYHSALEEPFAVQIPGSLLDLSAVSSLTEDSENRDGDVDTFEGLPNVEVQEKLESRWDSSPLDTWTRNMHSNTIERNYKLTSENIQFQAENLELQRNLEEKDQEIAQKNERILSLQEQVSGLSARKNELEQRYKFFESFYGSTTQVKQKVDDVVAGATGSVESIANKVGSFMTTKGLVITGCLAFAGVCGYLLLKSK